MGKNLQKLEPDFASCLLNNFFWEFSSSPLFPGGLRFWLPLVIGLESVYMLYWWSGGGCYGVMASLQADRSAHYMRASMCFDAISDSAELVLADRAAEIISYCMPAHARAILKICSVGL